VNVLRALVALLVPPYAVYRMRGTGGSFWLNVLLTIFGYILGSIHSLVVFAQASPEERRRTY
jgi:uncharacterized membrane protein YqaE (UPF0057 family)